MGITVPAVIVGAAAGLLAAVGIYTAVVPTSTSTVSLPVQGVAAQVAEAPPVVVAVTAAPLAPTCSPGSTRQGDGCVVTVVHTRTAAKAPARAVRASGARPGAARVASTAGTRTATTSSRRIVSGPAATTSHDNADSHDDADSEDTADSHDDADSHEESEDSGHDD